jgi:hypothetical protein
VASTVFYKSASELATLTNTFSVSSVATDPTTVSLTVTDPDGTATTYTYAAATITRTSAGIYTKDIPCSISGVWLYLWVGTGTASDAVAGTWTVQPVGEQGYCTLEEVKSRVGIAQTETAYDFEILTKLGSVTRGINGFCGRVFTRQVTATARQYYPRDACLVEVDDFYTTTDLAIATDSGDTGTYPTTITSTFYQLEPLNGIVDGETGWPYRKIRAVQSVWPLPMTRPTVQVTARWGWDRVPDPVHEAALILANEAFALKDSPFGVGGYGPFGVIRVRDNPMAARLLQRYQRHPVMVA